MGLWGPGLKPGPRRQWHEAETLLCTRKGWTQKRGLEAGPPNKRPVVNGHWLADSQLHGRENGARKGQIFTRLISPPQLSQEPTGGRCALKMGVGNQLGALFLQMIPPPRHPRLLQHRAGEPGVCHPHDLPRSPGPALSLGPENAFLPKHEGLWLHEPLSPVPLSLWMERDSASHCWARSPCRDSLQLWGSSSCSLGTKRWTSRDQYTFTGLMVQSYSRRGHKLILIWTT